MKLDPPPTLSPPWRSVSDWKAANNSIDFHLYQFHQDLKPAIQIARVIFDRLESISDSLDVLGRITCSRCPEICCLSASPWYDMRDLVYLHLNQLPIPLSQTISGIGETCCYISHGGCRLPRSIRPWICTWYLCPTQTAKLRNGHQEKRKLINRAMAQIKFERNVLENEFIRIVS